jgi:hypothetical protein
VVRVTYSNGTSYSWEPFGSTFKSGASVALGDVNDDGVPDIVVASGPSGTAGTVQVYSGVSRTLIASYMPLGAFGGGLEVAVGDVNDDGHADIVVGVESGGWPLVTVLNGATGTVMYQFLAYSTSFGGGVRVGVGNVSNNGYDDVVIAPGKGAHGMPVEVFSGTSVMTGAGAPKLISSFVPFPNYTGALSVAVGDLTQNGYADIVVGSQSSAYGFKVYNGQTVSTTAQPSAMFTQYAWSTADNSGINLALVPDATVSGLDDLIVTNGTGSKTARYLATQMTSTGWPTADAEFFSPIPGVNSAVFVG